MEHKLFGGLFWFRSLFFKFFNFNFKYHLFHVCAS